MTTFPDHRKDPRQKDEAWVLAFAKAIASDFASQQHRMFANNQGDYDLNRLYGMNKQPVNKYKTLSEVDESEDSSLMNVDWTPRGPHVKYIDLAIESVLENKYAPVATPIDMLSKDTNNKMIAEIKAKLLMRKMAEQTPELAEHPALQMNPGDPQDLEELEMRVDFGEQFSRAKDVEQVSQLALHENRIMDDVRPLWVRDSFYYGVSVAKTEIDGNQKPIGKYVYPGSFICSYCRHTFDSMWYAGELIDVATEDLSKFFEEGTMSDIRNTRNYADNPFANRGILYPSQRSGDSVAGSSTTLVLDLEFISYNTYHWKVGQSKFGNPQIERTGDGKKASITKSIQVVYRCKWIVGTDYIYEFGIKPNPREYGDPQKMSKTSLSWRVRAYNFHEMTVAPFMDRLKPLIDDYMMVMLKVQNVRNNLVPNGWAFDLDALESVNLTWGNKVLDTKGIIGLLMKKGVLFFRGKDLSGQNPNGKAAELMQNSISGEIASLYQELAYIVQQQRDVTGLNDLTDASTPNERMLNGVAGMAQNASNKALKPLMRSDRLLLTDVAKDLYMRVQQIMRMGGGYQGFIPTLSETTMRFVQADAGMGYKDCHIILEMRPNDDQKQMLIENMNFERQQGWLDVSDAILILNTYNLKQAQMMLAYKVKKNKEKKQQEAIQNQQATFKGQQDTAVMTETEKRKTIDAEWQWRLKLEEHITQRQLELKRLDTESKERMKDGELGMKAIDQEQKAMQQQTTV